MFIDIEELTEAHYLALMLVANLTELLPRCEAGRVVKELETTLHSDEIDLVLRQLQDVRMISVVKNGTNALYDREQPDCELELTRAGFAVLLNYPNRFLRKIADRFGEIPDYNDYSISEFGARSCSRPLRQRQGQPKRVCWVARPVRDNKTGTRKGSEPQRIAGARKKTSDK